MARALRDSKCVVCGNAAKPEYTISDEANNDQPFCSTDCQAICDNQATLPPRATRVKHVRGIGNSLGNANAALLSFPCTLDGCNERFSTPSEVLDHVKTHMTNGYPCTLEGCDEKFSTPSDVLDHVKTHIEGGTVTQETVPETTASGDTKTAAQEAIDAAINEAHNPQMQSDGSNVAPPPAVVTEQYPEIHLMRIGQENTASIIAPPAQVGDPTQPYQQPPPPQQQTQLPNTQALPQPGGNLNALSAPPAMPAGAIGVTTNGTIGESTQAGMVNGMPGTAQQDKHTRESTDSHLDTTQAANSLAKLNMSTAHLNTNNINTNTTTINGTTDSSAAINNNNTTTTMTLTNTDPDRQMTVFSEHTITYPCVFKGCTSSFSRGTSLANHAKTHTARQKFYCTRKECGKKFMSEGYLARHLRIHARKDAEANGGLLPGGNPGIPANAGAVLMLEGANAVASAALNASAGAVEGVVSGMGSALGVPGDAQAQLKRKAQDEQGGAAKTIKAEGGPATEKVVGSGSLALAGVGDPVGVAQPIPTVPGQPTDTTGAGTGTQLADSGHAMKATVVKSAATATATATAPTAGGVLVQYQDPATLPRVHKCTYEGCTASFTRGTSLANHSKTHNKERPYECTECGQTFMGPGYLSRHLKIHRKKAERAATLQLNWQW